MDVSTKNDVLLMVETSFYGVSLFNKLFKMDLTICTLLHQIHVNYVSASLI